MDYYMLNIIIAVFSLVVLSILIFENVPKVVLSLVKAAACADDWRCVDCACAKTE